MSFASFTQWEATPSLINQYLYPNKVLLYEYILIGFVTEICDVNYGYQGIAILLDSEKYLTAEKALTNSMLCSSICEFVINDIVVTIHDSCKCRINIKSISYI